MAEPTIIQVFGAGATQSGSTLTISKTDLQAVGLTPSASNTAESLLAAVLFLAQNYLTQTNFDANLDQSVTITPGFNSIVQRDDGTGVFVEYRQNQFNVNLHKTDVTTLDPDDY